MYLPGVTAPPAGLCGDAQLLAAWFLSHEGELAHCAASENTQRRCHGDTHRGSRGNQEEEERGEGRRTEQHAAEARYF